MGARRCSAGVEHEYTGGKQKMPLESRKHINHGQNYTENCLPPKIMVSLDNSETLLWEVSCRNYCLSVSLHKSKHASTDISWTELANVTAQPEDDAINVYILRCHKLKLHVCEQTQWYCVKLLKIWPLNQLVKRTSHVQRLCRRCSGPGFESRPGASICPVNKAI